MASVAKKSRIAKAMSDEAKIARSKKKRIAKTSTASSTHFDRERERLRATAAPILKISFVVWKFVVPTMRSRGDWSASRDGTRLAAVLFPLVTLVGREMLAKYESRIDPKDDDGKWFLRACRVGATELARWMWLRRGIRIPNMHGIASRALEEACARGRVATARWLIGVFWFPHSILESERERIVSAIAKNRDDAVATALTDVLMPASDSKKEGRSRRKRNERDRSADHESSSSSSAVPPTKRRRRNKVICESK